MLESLWIVKEWFPELKRRVGDVLMVVWLRKWRLN
jgi:hypothetical protein